jgi:hypothetical protein
MFLIMFYDVWQGVHRFYTGQSKIGFLYFFTLGLFGLGWLSDLYLQRRWLFGIKTKPASTGDRRQGVVRRGKDLIKNSTFAEEWRRKKGQGHQRLQDDAEGGKGAAGQKRRGRGHKEGKGGAFESCGADDESDGYDEFPEMPTPTDPDAYELRVVSPGAGDWDPMSGKAQIDTLVAMSAGVGEEKTAVQGARCKEKWLDDVRENV